MDGVQEVYKMKPGETIESGEAKIRCFNVSDDDARLYNVMNYREPILRTVPGVYCNLTISGVLFMSDTRMEKITNDEFVREAFGRVMIAGLGIGLIIHNLRKKIESGTIKEIVIFEISKDVIDLVSPFYKDLPVKYIHADIMQYKPSKEDMFDTIYFDIWENITTDNLKDMKILHNRWKFRKNEGGWMSSWLHKFLTGRRKQEKAY